MKPGLYAIDGQGLLVCLGESVLPEQPQPLPHAIFWWERLARPPYPFCHTPSVCSGRGYCPKEIACND